MTHLAGDLDALLARSSDDHDLLLASDVADVHGSVTQLGHQDNSCSVLLLSVRHDRHVFGPRLKVLQGVIM